MGSTRFVCRISFAFYLLYATLLTPCLGMAQENCIVTVYNADAGLPQGSIRNIIQDKNGFIWAGTYDGLCRFDGYHFKTYRYRKGETNGITSNFNYEFYLDSSRSLWILTNTSVCVYNAGKDNFTNIFSFKPNNIISNNTIFGEDAMYIWVGICGQGFIKINKRTHMVLPAREVPMQPTRSEFSLYSGFIEKNKMWSCHDGLNYVFDLQTKSLSKLPDSLIHILNVNDSEVVGTDKRNAYLINKRTLVIRSKPLFPGNTENIILRLYKLSDTVILICSSNSGLYFLDKRTLSFTKCLNKIDPGKNNDPLLATCAFRDNSDNLWIGTELDGLVKLTYPAGDIKLYNVNSSRASVATIYVDSQYALLSYLNKGIDVVSGSGKLLRHIDIPEVTKAKNNAIKHIARIDNERVFFFVTPIFAKHEQVPVVCNYMTGEMQVLGTDVIDKYEHAYNYRSFIVNGSAGDVYFDIENALFKFSNTNFKNFKPELQHVFNKEMLTSCLLSHDGSLWIGTYSGVYHGINGIWNKIKLTEGLDVKTMCEDLQGNLWIGTNSGIFIVDSTLKSMHHLDETNGLINEHIYGILCDNRGSLWFSHNKGISTFIPQGHTILNFSKGNGLQADEFNQDCYCKAPDGALYFGGICGVNSFYPKDLNYNSHTPDVKITLIRVNDRPLDSLKAPWAITNLQIPYDQSSIYFEFSLPEFTNPNRNQYEYMLEGLETHWTKCGTIHNARYSALKPGNYIFKLRAANNDGKWGSVTAVAIVIPPPFWETWWFRGSCVLAFTALIAMIVVWIQQYKVRKRMKSLELHNKLQSERERISRDLHDNVGTQLSLMSKSLKGLTHPLRIITEEEKMIKLSLVEQSSKEIIDSLRETIWALNKEETSLEEFSDKLKVFIQEKVKLNSEIRVSTIENIDDKSIVIGPAETLNLFRICQEAISNAMKYANATRLEVAITAMDGNFLVVIKDNGIGFDINTVDLHNHYGISNLKFRANEINCELIIASVIGEGTTITVMRK